VKAGLERKLDFAVRAFLGPGKFLDSFSLKLDIVAELSSHANVLSCLGNCQTFSGVSRTLSSDVLRIKYLIKQFGGMNCLKLNRHIWRIMLKKISCEQQPFQTVVVFYFAAGFFLFIYLVSLNAYSIFTQIFSFRDQA